MNEMFTPQLLINTMSSCNCPTGYLFLKEHSVTVSETISKLYPALLISNTDFDIGFLKWNPLIHSCGIVTQKLSHSNNAAFLHPLLSDIDLLLVDEELLPLVTENFKAEDIKIIALKNHNSSLSLSLKHAQKK